MKILVLLNIMSIFFSKAAFVCIIHKSFANYFILFFLKLYCGLDKKVTVVEDSQEGMYFFYDYTLPSHLLVIKQHMIQKYKDDKFDKAAFFIKVQRGRHKAGAIIHKLKFIYHFVFTIYSNTFFQNIYSAILSHLCGCLLVPLSLRKHFR